MKKLLFLTPMLLLAFLPRQAQAQADVPTQVATFENATVQEDGTILDGTASFTGFVLETITDGVGTQPDTQAAALVADKGEIRLTNGEDLVIDGLYVKSAAAFTIRAFSAAGSQTLEKTCEALPEWTYVNLRDMGPFTTLEIASADALSIDDFAGTPLTLEVAVDSYSETVEQGTSVALSPFVYGGVAPYSFVWRNAARQDLSSDETFEVTPDHSARYYVTVTDAWGNEANAEAELLVTGEMAIATFDDLYLPEESWWNGSDRSEDEMYGSFLSGSFSFSNLYMADWDSWAFFGYSNATSTTFSDYYTDQYYSSVGSGYDGSANYGVLYCSDWMGYSDVTVTNNPAGDVVPGCWFTNSAWVVDAILNGDGYEGPFEKDDELILHITGIDADGGSKEVTFHLADYVADYAYDYWYLDTWQWCDLSSLGAVTTLRFSITGTKSNSWGITTPTYVCLDNLGAPCPWEDADEVSLYVNDEQPSDSFSLREIFSFDPDWGTVVYDLKSDDERVQLDGNIVTVTAPRDETLEVKAHATQFGKHEYLTIPVKMNAKPSGIDAVTVEKARLYPNPAREYVIVEAPADNFSVAIIAMDGREVIRLNGCSSNAQISLDALSAGTYLVRISDAAGSVVRKLIVNP